MFFIDSNIPMYAAGTDSPQKKSCIHLLENIRLGKIKASSSAEVLQEILHRYRAINRLGEGLMVYDLFRSLPLYWLDISPQDVDMAKNILEQKKNLSSRDSLHMAVMQHYKIKKIITYDQGFLGQTGITVYLPDHL